MSGKADILVVEDNPGDQVLFRECAEAHRERIALHFVKDGVEALRFLGAEGRYAARPRPHAILLDFCLPGMKGRELMAEIRADARWKDIPVIVMSSSSRPDDVSFANAMGVSRYLVKPVDLSAYCRLVDELVAHCFELPTLAGAN